MENQKTDVDVKGAARGMRQAQAAAVHQTKPETPWQPSTLGKAGNVLPEGVLDLVPVEGLAYWPGAGAVVVSLHCTDFTSLCPVTHQPDYGEVIVEYQPGAYLVETKSFKLWLQQWRDRGVFNEHLCCQLAHLFFGRVQPVWVRVRVQFSPRGGVSPSAVCTLGEPGE